MDCLTLFGTCVIVGGQNPFPSPGNDNWRLMSNWKTPAEFMQWLKRTREEIRRELAADFRLRNCPMHRQHWETLVAMEKSTASGIITACVDGQPCRRIPYRLPRTD